MATRARKLTATVFATALVGAAIGAPIAEAASFTSDHKCSPGQHGNQHPGFKPGVCDNK